MATLLAFGVGLGNVGTSRRKRIPVNIWIDQLNKALSRQKRAARVIRAYGHTGNFVVSAAADPDLVATELSGALGTPCVVLKPNDLQHIIETLRHCRLTSRIDPGVRFTAGAAFLVIGTASDGLPEPTPQATYVRRDQKCVLLFKHDIETATRILDRNRRSGGWGAIATQLARALGGVWTARSIRTLIGTLAVARFDLTDTRANKRLLPTSTGPQ